MAGRGVAKISKIENFAKLTAVPEPDRGKAGTHFAPGVPNNAAIRNGYLPAGAKPEMKRGGSTDIGTEHSYDGAAEAQTSYD